MSRESAMARGRQWETECAEKFGGIRLGRPHEPDVVSPDLVIECKNEVGLAVSSNAINKARLDSERGPGKGKHWCVAKRQKGSHSFTATIDGDFFLELLELRRAIH